MGYANVIRLASIRWFTGWKWVRSGWAIELLLRRIGMGVRERCCLGI